MSERPKHQDEICYGITCYLSMRRNEILCILEKPDDKERNNPAVDFLVRSKDGSCWAIEHTEIESYEDQIYHDQTAKEFKRYFESELDGKLPRTKRFSVWLNPSQLVNLNMKDRKLAKTELADWIKEKARDEHLPEIVTTTPGQLKIDAMLCTSRSRGVRAGSLLVGLESPEIETQRRKRVECALEEKCPKLYETKVKTACCSVLALESRDYALANRALIVSALMPPLLAREDRPDLVYLVETDANPWDFWILKEENSVYPDVHDPAPWPWTKLRGSFASS